MASDSPEHDEPAQPAKPADAGDPLRLVLHTMEEQLDDRVDEVSDAKPAREESTEELIRLEETLSSAQDKAKQLVTLRLKLGDEESPGENPDGSPASAGAPEPSDGSASSPRLRPDLEERA